MKYWHPSKLSNLWKHVPKLCKQNVHPLLNTHPPCTIISWSRAAFLKPPINTFPAYVEKGWKRLITQSLFILWSVLQGFLICSVLFVSMPLELIFLYRPVRKFHLLSYQLVVSILNLATPILPMLKKNKVPFEHMQSQSPWHTEKNFGYTVVKNKSAWRH